MSADKIIKINNEHEVEYLKDRISLLESVIEYSVAEQVISLKDKVRGLENEAIALRAADSEKDKLIAEKETRIAEIKKNFDTQLANKLEWQRKQFELEKKQSLTDQRKNINAKIIKPKEELVAKAKEEVDRIQNMYESLLAEFKQVNEKLDTLLVISNSGFSKIEDLLNNGATREEIVKEIKVTKQSIQNERIIEECKRIHEYVIGGYSRTEIAEALYPGLARGLQKVKERIDSDLYQKMYVNIK